MRDFDEIQESCRCKVDDVIGFQDCDRESKWTESIAVGFKGFVEATKERLGIRAKGRKVFSNNGAYELQEPAAPYKGDFDLENGALRLENTYFWNDALEYQ